MASPVMFQRELGRSKLRFHLAFAILAMIVAVGMVAAALMGQRIGQISNEFERSQADNLTWRAAQLEAEYQRFRVAAADAMLAGEAGVTPAAWQEMLRRFDIYHSRVASHQVMLRDLAPMLHDRDATRAAMDRLLIRRDALARIIDSVDVPEALNLRVIWMSVAAGYDDVRAVVVQTRYAIDARSIQLSEDFVTLAGMGSRAIVGLSLTLILLAASAWHFHRRILTVADELAAARGNLQTIIDSSPDAVIVCNIEGKVIEYNEAAQAMFGYPRDAVMGRNGPELFIAPRLLRRLLRRSGGRSVDSLIRGALGRRLRLIALRRDGRPLQVELTTAMGWGPQGPFHISFARDISDRIRIDRQLRRARSRAEQSARAKDRFLSVMSHEMRTPLHGVIAALDLLGPEVPPDDTARLVTVARTSAETAISQIDDVLDLARLSAGGQLEPAAPFVPAEIVDDIVKQATLLAERKDTEITLHVDATARQRVLGQARTFRRAVANLVGNAVKFTVEGEIAVRLLAAGPAMLRVEVEDSGSGIAPQHLPRVFDDFFTSGPDSTEAGGAGLGLPIVAAAVKAMGGSHGVHSTEDEGSLFWFEIRLPPADATAAATTEPAAPDRPLLVLVVDDSEINRDLLGRMVSRLGHVPVLAESGRRAVEIARRQTFDLVFMDLRMPGIDGFAATRLIRADGASRLAQVYGVTAHLQAGGEAHTRAARAGMTEILHKPVTTRDIARVLRARRDDTPAPDVPQADAIRPAPRPAVLDRERWSALADLGRGDWLTDQIRIAFAELGALVAGMGMAPPSQPDHRLADEVHRASGTAAVLGLNELRSFLTGMETCLRTAGIDGPSAAAAELALAVERASDAIRYAGRGGDAGPGHAQADITHSDQH